MNQESIQAAVWGSLVGDALALGPHWEYKTKIIEELKIKGKFRYLQPAEVDYVLRRSTEIPGS